MSEPRANTERIFWAAQALASAGERARYLDQACGHDTELRARVEELLAAYPKAEGFLEPPVARGLTEPAAPAQDPTPRFVEGPGTRIGPYKLLELIGEGGMGAVWLAEQREPVQRKVALKIVKAGMDSRQVIARFEAERQALALMDHPNIARVFDGGTTADGRPYFVMELVKGVPITKYCDEHRLTPRERLGLFLPVCQALQHAHQKGIIHRDIKPANVLVAPYDGRPVPKVIDFGVAKAVGQRLTERTLFTGLGAVVGTLEYMSPEQAELNNQDIDTRSDIYALGVLLYELLTGTTPLRHERLKQAAFTELLRIIREEEPPRPSTRLSESKETLPAIAAQRHAEPAKLTKLVRGELDWIVMKALEKDRNRRYETANGLARDVEHYLADEPVQACAPTVGYRLRKSLRRNKGPVLAVTLVLLALFVGVVGTTWGMLRAEQQRGVAEANALQALTAAAAEAKAKETAETRKAETLAVLDFVENKILAAARLEGQEGGLGHDVTLRKAVEAALPFVEQSFTDQPLIEARLRLTLGKSFSYLGEAKIAQEQFEKARAIFTKHLGPDHPDTLLSMGNLAVTYADLRRYADAQRLSEETLALMTAKLGPVHPHTLASRNNLANIHRDFRRYAEALKLYEETLALCKAQLGPDHPYTLGGMSNLAGSYADLGRHAEALKLREETLPLMKARLGAEHPDTLKGMYNLANSYARLGRHAEAIKLHRQTLALMKAKLGPDHPATLAGMNGPAFSYFALGRHAEAIKLHEETVELLQAKFGPEHPSTLAAMSALASSYFALGRYAEALQLQEQTLALRKAKLGPDHPDTLANLHELGGTYDALGRSADALKLREDALARAKARFGPDHPDTLASMQNLGNSYETLGRHADAVKLREEALALTKAQFSPEHPFTLKGMTNVANSYDALGRHADALKLHEETLALQKAQRAADPGDIVASMQGLANSQAALGRYGDALKLREEALAVAKAWLGADHPDTLKSRHRLARSYYELERYGEALRLHEETLPLMKAKFGPDHPVTLSGMQGLADGYEGLGRHAEALQLREQTLSLRKVKLGPNHPHTLQNMYDLANSYHALGRHADALKLREETLALRKVKLGPDHPDTLRSMNTLAITYRALERYAEALKLSEDTLPLMKTKLGPAHPETLGSMVNLANSYTRVGRYAEALKLQEQTLALMKTTIPEHRFMLICMGNLANSYARFGRHADALKLREEKLALMKVKPGPDHPDTLEAMAVVADSLVQLDRGAEAVPVIDECLEHAAGKPVDPRLMPTVMCLRLQHFYKSKDVAGCRATAEMWEKLKRTDAGSLYTAACMRAVTASLIRAGDKSATAAKDAAAEADRAMTWLKQAVAAGYKDGEHMQRDSDLDALRDREDFKKLRTDLLEETLATCKVKLGPNDPETLRIMHNLGVRYYATGRHAEALKLRQETLGLMRVKLGPNDPATLKSMWGLAESLVKLDRAAEAVPVIDECVERAAGKAVDPHLLSAVLRLRLRHFEKEKDASGCRTTAEIWEKLKRTDAGSLYDAACIRAVAAAVIRAGNKSEIAARDATAEADRAMAGLKQAVAAGYRDGEHMQKDSDLDALRDREDFKKLVADLRASKAKEKK
jgi:serine/threonine protein kinase/tetratricopeptide (TPR) repeat protein